MKLSIVATLYQSAPYIQDFCRRSASAARDLVGDEFEIILVNDGSPDESLKIALERREIDHHVKVVDLSRNFGHHKAMMTGLAHSSGDLVFLIDSDLEEEPELVKGFAEQLEIEGCDVVYGVQERRKGGLFERISGNVFYWFFTRLTGLALPRNVLTARLMTRRYVEALVCHQEREVFMAGLWLVTGFKQHARVVKKHSTSPTTYSLRRKLAILVDSVTSFSALPLMGIFYLGSLISFVSFCYFSFLIVQWGFLAKPLSGWTSIMASIWLLGGMIIAFIGVVGVYVSKTFSEVKRRPYTIVRRVYGYED